MSLKEKILATAVTKRPPEPVEVPEWDCTVYVRVMSAADRERMEAGFTETGWRERLIVATVCDQDGKPIFTPADVPAISELDAGPIVRLQKKAMAMNKVGPAEKDTEKKD